MLCETTTPLLPSMTTIFPADQRVVLRCHCLATVLAFVLCLVLDAPAADPADSIQDYTRFALREDGDPARGQKLFFDEERTLCSRCHSIDGSSSKAGPDLQSVGDALPRHELIRSVLEPSARIAVGYETTVVETRDGELIQGVMKQTTPSFLDVVGADGSPVCVSIADIAKREVSATSLMPEGLYAGLSREEFANLIAYLTALRQPANLLAANQGMPMKLPVLAEPVGMEPFFDEALRFPHAFVHQPGDIRSGLVWFGLLPGSGNTYVAAHQAGKIWLLEKRPNGDRKSLFGDVAEEIFNERGPNGLLGLAFHPQFEINGRYFLKHQVFENDNIVTAVSERRAAPDRRTDSGQTSRRLWQVTNATQNHSGGCIEFGPDGYLYIAMGDTGPQQDPNGHGQDLTTYLGKILRIDVDRDDAGRAYAIPADNPFIGQTNVLPEVWAYGFREPWRFSFDRVTGELWVGDVGQDRVEEVTIVRRGENHGWNVFEGFEPFSNQYLRDDEVYVPPVFAYRRAYGNSITGGYVYRGDKQSSFYGAYICGDYTSRRLFAIKQHNRQLLAVREIGVVPQGIASFAEDSDGNILVVGYEGMVYRLVFAGRDLDDLQTSKKGDLAGSRNSRNHD